MARVWYRTFLSYSRLRHLCNAHPGPWCREKTREALRTDTQSAVKRSGPNRGRVFVSFPGKLRDDPDKSSSFFICCSCYLLFTAQNCICVGFTQRLGSYSRIFTSILESTIRVVTPRSSCSITLGNTTPFDFTGSAKRTDISLSPDGFDLSTLRHPLR